MDRLSIHSGTGAQKSAEKAGTEAGKNGD